MRTVLTVDDDLLQLLREGAARTRRSLREVVNGRLRLAYAGLRTGSGRKTLVVEPFETDGFAPRIEETKLNQLLDTLDAEDRRR